MMLSKDQGRVSKQGLHHDGEDDLSIKIPQSEGWQENGKRKVNTLSPGVRSIGGRRDSRNGKDKPVELFRKDLISAMKLPDTEQLQPDEYLLIVDPWRQDWESGVQVPVNPEETLNKQINLREVNNVNKDRGFKLPKKYFHASKDETYRPAIHELDNTPELEEKVCRYDLDYLDVVWLDRFNEDQKYLGLPSLLMVDMERIIDELETQCYNNMQKMIKTVEGLGIEYDENVVCDVCRSPEGEDSNEIVFCDGCDICVHQACYGIQKIPEGSWLCRTCALGIHPKCILCPKSGGAMKSTKSGSKWAHVSCALWIPEVSIGCPEKMEPIVKISQIPSSRWSLVCSLCRERSGACIQCSVKTCKTAFHVTCAFNNGLSMKTILDEEHDDVQLKAYCAKHSQRKDADGTSRKEPSTPTKRENILLRDHTTPVKKESEMTEEEKTELRSHRLAKLAEEFYSCVDMSEVAQGCHMSEALVEPVFNYWILKRKANFNKPLLMPKTEEADILLKQREDSLVAKMNMFIHLRQDLERVRNLCFMVSRREKIRRSLYAVKEEIFSHQVKLVEQMGDNAAIGTRYWNFISTAHKQPMTIYDQYDEILHKAHQLDAAAEKEAVEHFKLNISSRVSRLKVKKHRHRDSRRLAAARGVSRAKKLLLSSVAGCKSQLLRSESNRRMTNVLRNKRKSDSGVYNLMSLGKNTNLGTPVTMKSSCLRNAASRRGELLFHKSASNLLLSPRRSKRHWDREDGNHVQKNDSDSLYLGSKESCHASEELHSGSSKTQGKQSEQAQKNHCHKPLNRTDPDKDNLLACQDNIHSSPEETRACDVSGCSDTEHMASASVCSSEEMNNESQLSYADLRKVPSSLESHKLEKSTSNPGTEMEHDKDRNSQNTASEGKSKEVASTSPATHNSPCMVDINIEEDLKVMSHSPKKKPRLEEKERPRRKSNGAIEKYANKLMLKDNLCPSEREKKSESKQKSSSERKTSGNGMPSPQVEVSVDNNTGRITLRVRNNAVVKADREEALEDQKSIGKTYSKPLGDRKRSARIIHRQSLDSMLVESKHNRLVPKRINGLVSPSEVIVAPHIKDKVYSKLRCQRNYCKSPKNTRSKISERQVADLPPVKSDTVEIPVTRTDPHILTKENNPAHGITRHHPNENCVVSPQRSKRRNHSIQGLSKSRRSLLKSTPRELYSKRRRMSSSLNVSSQTASYVDMNREDGFRSSRETTPDHERVYNTRHRCSNSNSLLNGLPVDGRKTDSESDKTVASVLDSDSDYAPSDISDLNIRRGKSRINRVWDSHDETSRDSTPSIRSSSRLSQSSWTKFSSL